MVSLNRLNIDIKVSRRIFSPNRAFCLDYGRIRFVLNESIPRNESQLRAAFRKLGRGG